MNMRYTVDIPEKLAEVFKNVANEEQISQSELMRKALLTYAVLHKETTLGKAVAITKDGVVEKELILAL
jgi:metal-responsive CopG/Arc/MetJ family transcriptional regulator